VPQLDRYLVTSEIFWFLSFFLVSFLIVNFLLLSLFQGSRFRRVLFLEHLLFISKLKFEKLFFNKLALPRLELGLVSLAKLDKFFLNRQRQLYKGWDFINFYLINSQFSKLDGFIDHSLVSWIKKMFISEYIQK
jgi:hypothetical protein